MKQNQDKLKPSQPFFVLGSEKFRQEVYLKQGISHFYTFKVTGETDFITVPDGCIDLLFEYTKSDMKAYACGTVLKCSKMHWEGSREIFGVRFMPGYLPAGLKTVLKDLIEKRILLYDLIENVDIINRMSQENDFYQRIRVFLEEYTKFEHKREKPYGKVELCMSVKDMVYNSNGTIKVYELSEKTGYTERYINKVFIELMGFSPKTFCKIIQFQKALEVLNYGPTDKMTKVAVDLGYYDQAKFIKDFKEYAGITPNRYLRKIQEENYRKRINNS